MGKLADVVDGDVLRAVRPPHLVGDNDCSYVLVRQFDEGTLHEHDEQRVIAFVRDRHLEVRPRRLAAGVGCRVIRRVDLSCSIGASVVAVQRISGKLTIDRISRPVSAVRPAELSRIRADRRTAARGRAARRQPAVSAAPSSCSRCRAQIGRASCRERV